MPGDRTLYGPDGKPMKSSSRSQETSLAYLSRMGIERKQNGDLVVPNDVLQRVRGERLRAMTVTSVPSTPRFISRDAGGIGVQKGHARFETFSLAALRKLRERSPMIQAIHSARHYQVRRLSQRWTGKKGDVGWRVVHKAHKEFDADPPASIKPYIKRFENMFDTPSPRYCKTTATMMTQLVEDLLTINRPVLEVLYSMFDKNRIVGFKPVDGELVWPTLLWVEKWQNSHPQWYGGFNPDQLTDEQILDLASESAGWDLYGTDYCLVREGQLEGVYPANKLFVAPIINRTDIQVAGYPPSHVEQAIEVILAQINAWDFNSSLFTRGMMAEFILGISGDVMDEDIQGFVDQFREASQGVRRAHQPPIMPLPIDGTIQKIDLKPVPKEMMFEVWFSVLSSLTAAVYRMDMSSVNFKPWDGGSGGSLSEPNRHDEIALAKEEGLQGDIQHLTENIFNELARTLHPDLRVMWEYGDFDPLKEAELYEIRARTSMSRNDVRLADGQKPRGFWMNDEDLEKASDEDQDKFHANLWNMPTGDFASSYNQMKMQDAMAQEGEQGPQDDGFGSQPGEDQDGFGGGPGPGTYPFGQAPSQQGGSPEPAGQPMNKARPSKITVYVEEH